MDSQAISSTQATPAVTAQPASRTTPGSSAKAADVASEAKAQDAKAVQAEPDIPQRDPRSLQYQVDGATHRIVATIVDADKTVVRQIPDAEVLRIARAIDRMQGFLVEERA